MTPIHVLCLNCDREMFEAASIEAAKAAGWTEVRLDPFHNPKVAAWDHFGYCKLCFPDVKREREQMILDEMDKHKWDKLPKPIKPLTLKPSDFEGYC